MWTRNKPFSGNAAKRSDGHFLFACHESFNENKTFCSTSVVDECILFSKWQPELSVAPVSTSLLRKSLSFGMHAPSEYEIRNKLLIFDTATKVKILQDHRHKWNTVRCKSFKAPKKPSMHINNKSEKDTYTASITNFYTRGWKYNQQTIKSTEVSTKTYVTYP